ncbi:unnamed protein product [Brassica rapa]|uniref:Uncharacterized protein n=1 Tax=Brassica campestris TaxID=3711 RepID=A0A8D9DCV1_BRACM|nr:unnamed protein product [Brassica rapa]
MTLDYKPSEEFEVSKLQSLLDFDVTTGAKELWLIQCPTSHVYKDNYKAIVVIRHHLAEGLKDQYLTIENPLELWTELKTRFNHQKTVILPKALYDWRNLRVQDYKSVEEYNSALFKIVSKLKLCDMALKISRRVSLVRFPKLEVLLETMKGKTKRKLAGAAVTSSSVRNSNPAQSCRRKSGQSSLRHSTSNSQKSVFPSSSTKTLMSSSKRKHSEPSSSKHHSSATTVPGSSDRSDKSKKKVKTEN